MCKSCYYRIFAVCYEIGKTYHYYKCFILMKILSHLSLKKTPFITDFSIFLKISLLLNFQALCHGVLQSTYVSTQSCRDKAFWTFGNIFVTENVRGPYFFIVLFNNSFSAFFLSSKCQKFFLCKIQALLP